ncbi:MAG: hypothetical protein ACRD59_00105 [Candidatus Acidiferrales bacterium]
MKWLKSIAAVLAGIVVVATLSLEVDELWEKLSAGGKRIAAAG